MKIYEFNDKDISYVVNTENKTVTASVKDLLNDDKLYKTTMFGKMASFVIAVEGYKHIPSMYNSFSAIARCKAGEEFDVEKGKRVARLKLIKHITQQELNLLSALYARFDYLTETARNLALNNMAYREDRITNIVGYLTKE